MPRSAMHAARFCSAIFCFLAVTNLSSPSVTRAQQGEQTAEPALFAYVGTFSSPLKDVLPTQVDLPPGNGRGIHIFRVDRTNGQLTPAGTFDLGTSPSSLVVNDSGDRLYSANETDRVGDPSVGTVSAFAINQKTGTLDLLNTVPSGGAGPTFVSIHPSKQFLLVANYFGGSIAVLPILADGRLGDAVDVKAPQGKIGPPRAQNAPPGSFAFSGHDRTHAHMIQSDPSGKFVFHVDLGLDRIFIWKIDLRSGKLSPAEQPFFEFPPGDGPRHFAFHPTKPLFYSIQEEGSTIVVFDFDSTSGRLTEKETISTLPQGYAGSNFCSEILVSSDGRFVYAGNRLHDSVGIFAVKEDGRLNHVDDVWTRGNYPRSFNFDPSGKFFYCCNQRADHISVFKVDSPTGILQFTGQFVPVGNPSCITFLELPIAN